MKRSAVALLALAGCTDPVDYGGVPVGDSGATFTAWGTTPTEPTAPTGTTTGSTPTGTGTTPPTGTSGTTPPTGTTSSTGTTPTGTATGTTPTGTTTGTTPTGSTTGSSPTVPTGTTPSNPYTFTTSTAGSNATTLPCTVVLPADTIVVDSTIAASDPGKHYLVCAHEVLSYSGSFANIYIENQADAVVNGDTNAIWLTSNAAVAFFKEPNTVVYEAGAQVDTSGLPNIYEVTCTSVTYDTSLMPSGGC